MLINFGIVKDFKNTDKCDWLKKSLETKKVKFASNIKKLKSYQIYSSDIVYDNSKTLKVIWTKFKVDKEECLVLLDVIKGKYEKSKYFKQKLILEQFFQTGDPIYGSIKEDDFEDSVYELGEEIEEPLYFSHRKVVKLSYDQESIFQKEFSPGFYVLSGIAGSGKTSLAYLKLKELHKEKKNCLFTTGNGNLADYLKSMFAEEEQGENVEFFGYKDLVDYYYRGVSDLEKVGFNEFNKYIQGKKLGKIELNHKLLYSLMQYIASKPDIIPGKRDFFKEIGEKEFKYCVELYSKYLQYLTKENKIDLSLSALEVIGEKTFDYIIVDESQDLSPREIENISLLKSTDTGVIIFNVDSNQHSNISLPIKYLKSHVNTREFINVLDSSFRIPQDISKYAQGIVEARSLVIEGVPDKDMIRQFSSSNETKGNIAHINLHDAKKLVDAANIALITFDNRNKLEAEDLLPQITQVFTADEIKGLEYETVVVYDPYRKFSEILAKHHAISWIKSEVKNNLPKDINTVDHDVKILFNKFFTSVTRAKNNLYILESCPESINRYCLNFKEYLIKDIEPGYICEDDKRTDKDWIHQINALAVNDNISQAVKAYKKRDFSLDKIREKVAITYELYLIAVLSNIEDLRNVPKIYKNHKLYSYILKYKNFKDIPELLKDIDFCKSAISIDINNILYVPHGSIEIYKHFLKKFDNLLSQISQHLQTPELCLTALEEDFENNFVHIPHKFKNEVYRTILVERYNRSIQEFPKEFINQTLVGVAVGIDVHNLKYVPEIFLTDGTYRSALKSYSNSLQNFPKELMNQALVGVAVGIDVHNLKYVPEIFLTDATYRSALKSYGNSLQDFPREFINKSLAELAVTINPSNLKYYPYKSSLKDFAKELITQDIAEVAVGMDVYNLYSVYGSKNHFNLNKIYKSALKSYDNSLQKFPKEFINKHLSEIAIQLDIDNLKYISDDQKTYKIYQLVIEACDNSLENFLQKFPKESVNQTIAGAAVSVYIHNLKYIPEIFLTDATYKSALKSYGNSLQDFPKEFINKSLAEVAVTLNPSNLEYYPYKGSLKDFAKELITQDIAEVAVGMDVYNLKYVPEAFLTCVTYRSALKSCDNSLQNFPKEFINKSLAEVAVLLNPSNLEYYPYKGSLKDFPKELITQDIAKVAIGMDMHNLKYISDKILDDDTYISILRFYDNSLKEFPSELLNSSLAELAVKLNADNLAYIPDKFLSNVLDKEVLEQHVNKDSLSMVGENSDFYE